MAHGWTPLQDNAGNPDSRQLYSTLRSRVSAVGTALILTAVLGGFANLGSLVLGHAIRQSAPPTPPPAGMTPSQRQSWEYGRASAPFIEFVCVGALSLAVYIPVFLGGLSLAQGRGYGLGVTAAILAMVPCSLGWLLGVPIGIWALIVLNNANVKQVVFRRGLPSGA